MALACVALCIAWIRLFVTTWLMCGNRLKDNQLTMRHAKKITKQSFKLTARQIVCQTGKSAQKIGSQNALGFVRQRQRRRRDGGQPTRICLHLLSESASAKFSCMHAYTLSCMSEGLLRRSRYLRGKQRHAVTLKLSWHQHGWRTFLALVQWEDPRSLANVYKRASVPSRHVTNHVGGGIRCIFITIITIIIYGKDRTRKLKSLIENKQQRSLIRAYLHKIIKGIFIYRSENKCVLSKKLCIFFCVDSVVAFFYFYWHQ